MAGPGDAFNQSRQIDQDADPDRPDGARTLGDDPDGLDASSTKETRTVQAKQRAGSQAGQNGGLAVATAGLEIGLAIVALTLLGRWLDGWYGTTPWLMLVGLAMGMIGGTYNVWKIGRSFFDD